MRPNILRHCLHVLQGTLCQLCDHPATKESKKDINNNNNNNIVSLFILFLTNNIKTHSISTEGQIHLGNQLNVLNLGIYSKINRNKRVMGKVDCMHSQNVTQLSLEVSCNLPKHEGLVPNPMKRFSPAP